MEENQVQESVLNEEIATQNVDEIIKIKNDQIKKYTDQLIATQAQLALAERTIQDLKIELGTAKAKLDSFIIHEAALENEPEDLLNEDEALATLVSEALKGGSK